MKKLIVTACAAIASAVALASTVESSNVFGVLKVSASNGKDTKQFAISVPWEAVGTTGTAIDPTALVLPSNLEDNAMLYVYGANATPTTYPFGAWKVTSGAWVATTVVDDKGMYTTGTDATVQRGISVVVQTKATEIYLSGQYASSSSEVLVKGATSSGPVYTLIGGNLAKSLNLNAITIKEDGASFGARDEIRVNLGANFTYNANESKWQKVNPTAPTRTITLYNGDTRTVPNYTTDEVTLDAGQGAWYIRRDTGDITLVLPSDN